MSKKSNKIAFFDVDNTLVDGYTGFYTTLQLIRYGALRKRYIAKAMAYRAISRIYKGNVRKMYELTLADLAGWSLEDIMRIGRECFERDIRPRIFQEAIDLVEKHKAKGHRLYFVTSGPYMTVKLLGEFLDVRSDYAPGPVVREGILQKELRKPLPYREGKLQTARLIVEQEGTSLTDCYFYTDNVDDLSLLKAVGYPRVVNPERRLARVAAKEKWPRLHFKTRLGEAPQ